MNLIGETNNNGATKAIFFLHLVADGRGLVLFCNILRDLDFVFSSSLNVCETCNQNLTGKNTEEAERVRPQF